MHPVKRSHLVAVLGNNSISPDITDRYFTERVNCKNHDFKHCIQNTKSCGNLPCLCKFTFCKINGKYKKADQHDIYADKIDAGHD